MWDREVDGAIRFQRFSPVPREIEFRKHASLSVNATEGAISAKLLS
jgi:hypothetical protein